MSNTVFFGSRWDAPLLDGAEQTQTPVGKPCMRCTEPIVEGDRGLIRVAVRQVPGGAFEGTSEPIHAECELIGVVGHTVGVCGCRGYDTATRAAARLTWERVGERRGRPLEEPEYQLVNVQLGDPGYEELIGQIRADAALREQMWQDAEHRLEESPDKIWSLVIVRVDDRWVPAAWAAARVVDGVLVCSDNYERRGFRGSDLGRDGWGFYPKAYAHRHVTVVVPSGLPAQTFIFAQPRALHEAGGWVATGLARTSHEADEPHPWLEMRRDPGGGDG